MNVSAFGPNPDGEGIIFRVWEQGGITGKLEVNLPSDAWFTSAQPVNLRGEKHGEPLAVKNGKFLFDLNAYAPASFILTK